LVFILTYITHTHTKHFEMTVLIHITCITLQRTINVSMFVYLNKFQKLALKLTDVKSDDNDIFIIYNVVNNGYQSSGIFTVAFHYQN
jgi:hypothetical protein